MTTDARVREEHSDAPRVGGRWCRGFPAWPPLRQGAAACDSEVADGRDDVLAEAADEADRVGERHDVDLDDADVGVRLHPLDEVRPPASVVGSSGAAHRIVLRMRVTSVPSLAQ